MVYALPCYSRKEVARVNKCVYSRLRYWKLRDWYKEYHRANHAHVLEYAHQHYQINKERRKQYAREWYQRRKEYVREYCRLHKSEKEQRDKEWRANHRELIREYVRRCFRKHREIQRRASSKRRTLGFVAINQIFVGSHAHHIDREHVCFVPKELHESIRHNLWTGKNMKEINAKVFDWLKESNQPFMIGAVQTS